MKVTIKVCCATTTTESKSCVCDAIRSQDISASRDVCVRVDNWICYHSPKLWVCSMLLQISCRSVFSETFVGQPHAIREKTRTNAVVRASICHLKVTYVF